jgi:hypothetical protein
MKSIRVLVYKRTHPGDPDEGGWFGINDCMGAIGARRFDAVIGVGGLSAEPRRYKIAGKLNWIGIGAHRDAWYERGPRIIFDQFRNFGTQGDSFRSHAPRLAERMYGQRIQHYD